MSGSVVVITLGGADITNRVIFESASFENLINAQPGVCEFTCLDPSQDFDPITGDEITLEVDGVLLWGGYLTQVSRTHPFAADLVPVDPNDYSKRYWILRGVDFNILFDKRVVRRTANYVNSIPSIAGSTQDGAAITSLFTNYIDTPAGFDVSTYVDDITTVSSNGTSPWSYVQQGTKVREQMDQLTFRSAAVYYFDAAKNLHWHAIEDIESRWGFSDQPNNVAITASPVEFQNATYGFREVEATEDGTGLVNDALIWGGSEWAGAGSTVFKRTQDTTSQTNHGRWQVGEAHFGEPDFGIQDDVDARANAIVLGPPGADAYGQLKGLRYSQWSFGFAWHDKDVPSISGTKIHLTPGQLVTIELATFGETKLLPLRSLRISFPEGNPADSSTYVRFDGQFGLQLSDAFTLWRYLVKRQDRPIPSISTVDSSSPSTPYGALFQGEPTPATDGATTVFTIPFGYIPGTTQVFKDGILQVPGTAYTESDYEAGQITVSPAPAGGTELWVVCRTLAG